MLHHSPTLRARFCGAVVLLAAALTTSAPAAIIPISSSGLNSENGLGSFTGSIEYFVTGSATGTLKITLTNTSDPANGGFITGFVFNIASADAAATLTSWTHPFMGILGQHAPPFGGPFAAGAALGGHWAGGGNPNAGIAVGQTGVFEFQVSASDAPLLSPGSFINGPLSHNFIVRFRGFNDGGSDKVPAVPAPAALALLALGGVIGRPRRRG